MGKRQFSARRRRLLQSGVATLASAPVVGLTDGGIVPCPPQSAQVPVCIRSPWVYYPLRNATINEQGESSETGNEGFPGLVPATQDSGQWLDNFDWWTGNGAGRALTRSWDSDPARIGSVMLPGRFACLIGVQLAKTQATGVSESLLLIGRLLSGGSGRGLHLKLNSAAKPQVTLWDDDGNTISLVGRDVVNVTNDGQCTLFVYIDHRADGSRTLSMHQFETGTDVQSSTVQRTHTLGAITGAMSPDNEIIVGARRQAGGSLDQFYLGSLRGVMILNFGTTPSANISGIMEDLSATDMEPDSSMQGV
ncbi:MAG: hypothetical protein OEQ74_00020 [Gammaproteobacteria bacterium]|nr:hypothetical protein [Gammaproteobacteria bacterium]